jgi:hypothetical protein
VSRVAQRDLFAAEEERERAEWEARFERADWVAPYDTTCCMKKGDRLPSWRCPACGEVEANEFLLGNNHGYHLWWPGQVPYGGGFGETCYRLWLEAAHASHEERQRAWNPQRSLF